MGSRYSEGSIEGCFRDQDLSFRVLVCLRFTQGAGRRFSVFYNSSIVGCFVKDLCQSCCKLVSILLFPEQSLLVKFQMLRHRF